MSKREDVKFVARRTCTVVDEDEAERLSETTSAPLESFTSTPAYVLIGEPGTGKTMVFKSEAEKTRRRLRHRTSLPQIRRAAMARGKRYT